MKGARALASGMLVLAAVCAVPAISAAQDAATTDATTTTTAQSQSPPPPEPTQPAEPSAPAAASPTEPAAGTPGEAPGDMRTADSQLADSPPADGSGGGARKAASASVTMGDFFFSPASVSVAVGDTVTWRNNGDAPHNAVADDGSFSTPTINKGQSASHTFNSAGTFSYICTIHPQMKGTVRVLSSSSGGGGAGTGSSATGSDTSEASAVASPEAAGDSNTLPMTGLAAGALALVGLALLAAGLLMQGVGRRWISPF